MKMMKNTIITLTAISTLCVFMGFLNPAMAASRNPMSRNPMSRIHPGMTYNQVRTVLGTPTSKVFLNNHREQWLYSKRGYNGRPYHSKVIEFRRNRVVAFYDRQPSRHRSCHRPHPRYLCRYVVRPMAPRPMIARPVLQFSVGL